jgi:hypothetical protein
MTAPPRKRFSFLCSFDIATSQIPNSHVVLRTRVIKKLINAWVSFSRPERERLTTLRSSNETGEDNGRNGKKQTAKGGIQLQAPHTLSCIMRLSQIRSGAPSKVSER